jgi:hypothetical protein
MSVNIPDIGYRGGSLPAGCETDCGLAKEESK